MQSEKTVRLIIAGDISITVPVSIEFAVTYILTEQQDWFEDEVKFIRHLIKPGMKVIDIGANYGQYTLPIAKSVGVSGKVWAFEPTSTTAKCLKESISDNDFSNVELIQAGLSNGLGTAKLSTNVNSELNSIMIKSSDSHQFEEISLTTLDYCGEKYNWNEIDFIKLDAEGEELNIIEKGKELLSSTSPLIMFEIKQDEDIKLPLQLFEKFNNLGFKNYRLIPGLNILVPFDQNEPVDKSLLNLFCCKDDKAEILESDGFLVGQWEDKKSDSTDLTKEYIGNLPYGKILFEDKQKSMGNESSQYLEILNLYILSQSEKLNSQDRVSCLMSAVVGAQSMLSKGENNFERLVTFSRIFIDAGKRALGVKILYYIIKHFGSVSAHKFNELFLPAEKRYEEIISIENIYLWALSSVIEQAIKKCCYSACYNPQTILPLFKRLEKLGYMNEEMHRRYELLKQIVE